MAGADKGQRAVVVLVQDGREVVLGSIDDTIRCDLALVDELLKLSSSPSAWGGRFASSTCDRICGSCSTSSA